MKLIFIKGYTLLELLVVLAMVGILAMVAVPSFNHLIKENRLRSTANQLHSVFKFARTEAAKRETEIDLVASGSQWSVQLDSEVLNVFKSDYDSVSIDGGLIDLVISATGAASSQSFLVTDGDSSTDDYCLYIYVSGQSQLVKESTCT